MWRLKILLKILKFKLTGKKMILINEAAGLGDYLWVRNYFKVLKNHPKYSKYKIVFLATERWLDFAKDMDLNYTDIFIPLGNPHKLKSKDFLFFLFSFDIFINFRQNCELYKDITNSVKAKKIYNEGDFRQGKLFYSSLNRKIMEQIVDLKDFKHTIEIKYDIDKYYYENNYCVLTLGGFSEGKLNLNQLKVIVETIYNKFKIKIVVVGFKNDIEMFNELKASLSDEFSKCLICGCGTFKTSQLPALVNSAKFIVTTNTSIWHFSLQLNKPHILFSIEAPWIYDVSDCFDINNICFITDKNTIRNIDTQTIKEKMNAFFEKKRLFDFKTCVL